MRATLMMMRRASSIHKSPLDSLSPVWQHLTTFQPVKGNGIYLYDQDGQRFMDFTSGIGVVNTGHCHPKVVSAIQEQANALIFGQVNIVIPPATIALAERLRQHLRQADATRHCADQVFFANSGAEAVEASVKLARHATGKRNLVVFQGSFHGRTHQTMAMTTAKYIYRVNYQPLPGGVFVAPFPFHQYYQDRFVNCTEDDVIDVCLDELQTLLRGQTAPAETAAVIIEPVLGEGGYVPAPARFLRELRRICTEHGMLLIADEVQSGMGRTGKLFAVEHTTVTTTDDANDNDHSTSSSVQPDILVMAKGLGSGMPISAIASRQELMERWQPGSHGGTYGGGSAVAAAAAIATLDVIHEEGLLANATQRGRQLLQGCRALQHKYGSHVLTDVRGLGLMVATELADATTAKAVQQACLERNLLVLTCGTYENILRWIPPLIVTAEQIDEALAVLDQAMEQVLVGTDKKG